MRVMDDTHELVPSAHRPLRRVESPDAAYPGELVTDGERVRVRVDADAVPDPLWAFAAAEHVAGVRDVLRRRDGQDALLPWCTDRVEAFLGRRIAAERPLAAGEVVTLVGSMLRGVDEVGDAGVSGCWWLGDDGRPLFAPGEGVRCVTATRGIVERLRAGTADRALERVLTEITEQPDDPRMWSRRLSRWEDELTELAAPRALTLEDAEAVPAAMPARRALRPTEQVRDASRPRPARSEGELRRTRRARVRSRPSLRAVVAGVRARTLPVAALLRGRIRMPLRLRRATPMKPARPTTPQATAPGGRGRMLLVGAAVAVVVVIGGVLWPEGGESSAEGAPAAQSVPSPTPATGTPVPSEAPDVPATNPPPSDAAASGAEAGDAPDGIERSAAETMAAMAACAEDGDEACAAAIVDGAAETVWQRLGDDLSGRAPALIEDYGDVAVVRLAAGQAAGEQMLVLVRQKDGWLVRDVYDVADQPSEAG